jgi:hypothetical protein
MWEAALLLRNAQTRGGVAEDERAIMRARVGAVYASTGRMEDALDALMAAYSDSTGEIGEEIHDYMEAVKGVLRPPNTDLRLLH